MTRTERIESLEARLVAQDLILHGIVMGALVKDRDPVGAAERMSEYFLKRAHNLVVEGGTLESAERRHAGIIDHVEKTFKLISAQVDDRVKRAAQRSTRK